MDQNETWYADSPRPWPHCVRWRLSSPPQKGCGAPQFSAHFYCRQTAGWIKMALGMEVGLDPGHIVPALSPKSDRVPQSSAHFCCGQTAVCIKIPLGTEVGLSLGDIVLDGDQAPPPLEAHSLQYSANVRCGQTAAWTKMPFAMEVGLGPGDFVLDGDLALRRKRHNPHPPNFWPMSVMAKRLDGSRCRLVRR